MADDETQDGDQSGEPESEPDQDQPDETAGGARRAAEGLQSAAKKTGELTKKLVSGITNLVGPGSKIKLGILVIVAGIFAFAFLMFFFGLTMSILARSGSGGTTPQERQDVAEQAERERLQLIACLKQAPQTGGDPAKKGEILLAPECIKVNREQVAKARAQIKTMEDQLAARTATTTDPEPASVGSVLIPAAQAQATPTGAAKPSDTKPADTKATGQIRDVLGKITTELDGIDQANGKFKPTDEHFKEANRLIKVLIPLWSQLTFDCGDVSVVLGEQSSADPTLFRLKGGGASPIKFFYKQNSRFREDLGVNADYVSKEMACYLATLTVQAKAKLGLDVEIGDASISSGVGSWGGHGQHGGGGNADIWAPKVMMLDLQGSTADDGLAVQFAKLIIDLGAKELFITQSEYLPDIRRYSINAGGHANHWHICIHTGC